MTDTAAPKSPAREGAQRPETADANHPHAPVDFLTGAEALELLDLYYQLDATDRLSVRIFADALRIVAHRSRTAS